MTVARAPEAQKTDSRAPHGHFGFRFVTPLGLGSTLNPVNSTMISTALVPIAGDFHASVAQTGWLIAGLYLASAVAQPTMGRLADLFGPRRVYLVALILVALSGLIGEFAPSLGVLVAARVLLGIGTSGAYPSAMRLFRLQADRFGYKAPPRIAMGVLSLSAIASMAVGPLLGGVLTGAFGWHAIFLINLPLAAVTAVLTLIWVPRDDPVTNGWCRLVTEVDLAGIALFVGFLLSLMIFLMNLSHPIWWTLPVATGFLVCLVAYSRNRRQPFIDVRMLARNAPLSLTYLRAGLVAMITYCVLYGFGQWLESGAHYTAAQAGLFTLPMSVIAAISSFSGARTKGIRAPFVIAIGSAVIGCACLLFVNAQSAVWWIAAAVVFFGPPQGMFSTATQAAIYIQAPASEIGTAAGLQRTAAYIGAIAATSLLGLVYGTQASDGGLHNLALIMGGVTALLFVFTLFDRTLPRTTVTTVQ